jgi:ubiquinone/menaquinone biosynthesis C-methylase UbiE
VISTLVLCTVDDQPRALRKMRRVLRSGGRLLFIEHVRSEDAKLARLQDRVMPINLASRTAAIATGRRSTGSATPASKSPTSSTTHSSMPRRSSDP